MSSSPGEIRRLLIANRGEIVCRIARTARSMGIVSIAAYSDADRGARHVRECDEALHLGGSAAADSYLNVARIVALAKDAGADAVHPGYGFLSENADFADACTAASLSFIGPPSAAIRAMGSKSASKAAMAAVGVPVAAGYHGDDQSIERLMTEADRIGFPLIIKASAGGGGKGMQVVESSSAVAPALESARRLARASFGDDRLLMERYFPQARHVEVQIFADLHGNYVSLFDRDCSVQRRHQKIIEEAPAPGIEDAVRAAMSQAALLAARTVGYVGAGTVEFLLDPEHHFYFMEMNTRLQVEHPVTERIAGVDLVEWQLRVARGEPLPCGQQRLHANGHAVEARLYAEDPARGYLPSVGRIEHLRWPQRRERLRIDSGIDAGDDVTSFYDPMLGKVIAWGETRTAAIDELHGALREIEIVGVTTNRALLGAVLADAEFREGPVSTNFLSARQAHLSFGEPPASPLDVQLAGMWCAGRRTDGDALWADTRGWRLGGLSASTWTFDGGTVRIAVRRDGRYSLMMNGKEVHARLVARTVESLTVEIDKRYFARILELRDELHLFLGGRHVALRARLSEDALRTAEGSAEGSLLTPLPGTVVAVHVADGQAVSRGAPLVTVEAMKMEHTLTAPADGVVARIAYGVGERVAAGAILVELQR